MGKNKPIALSERVVLGRGFASSSSVVQDRGSHDREQETTCTTWMENGWQGLAAPLMYSLNTPGVHKAASKPWAFLGDHGSAGKDGGVHNKIF